MSAGANQSVETGDRVDLRPSANSVAEVATFDWSQIAGPVAVIESDPQAAASTLVVRAPGFAAELEFEVTGRRADGSVAGVDRVQVVVSARSSQLTGTALSTITVRGGGAGRAAASALHEATSRLFVLDEVAGEVLCYSVANPAAPSFVAALPIPADVLGFQADGPLALACGKSGPLAIAWSGETIKFPGRMQFIDPDTLQELNAFSTFGARPVDVDANDDGTLFAVACAGDRQSIDQADGLGHVTLVTIPAGGAGTIVQHQHVAPIPLTAFDGQEATLQAEGVRFFRSPPQASLELAPRAVAVANDGSLVWVACPVNNALITLDPQTGLATGITAMPDRPSGDLSQGTTLVGTSTGWDMAPNLAFSPAGDAVPVGGVSGLLAPDAGGVFRFVSGSGPTLETVDLDNDGVRELPHVDPAAQLAVRELALLGAQRTIEIVGQLPLVGAGGVPVVGAPNVFVASPGLAGHDERAIDLNGATVLPSAFGGRFEGATETPNGDIWLADSRRCSLWRISSGGSVLGRFTPGGTLGTLGSPILPAVFGQRRVNLDFELHRRFGGFGAIAYSPDRSSILAIPRLPLDNPDTPEDITSASSRIIRIIELDVASLSPVGEFVYVLEAADHAVEGLTSGAVEIFSGGLAVLEAGLGADGMRAVFDLDLDGATNLRTLSLADYQAVSAVLEGTSPADLGGLAVPVVPVGKRVAVDLVEAGFGGDARPSGILFASPNQLTIAFDDGFQGTTSGSFDPGTGALSPGTITGSFLVRGTIEPLRFDTANDGLPAPQANGVPAIGLAQPLDLVAVEAGGVSRVLTANGGRARVLTQAGGGAGEDERVLASDQVLDTMVFPGAASWQRDPFGGDLLVSERDADLGGDGLADRLAIFGSRSISVVDDERRVRWTSSATLVDRARVLSPARLDAASTTSGLRPRALARGVVSGRPIVATAFEGAGLVGAHFVDHPDAPLFAGFVGQGGTPSDVDLASPGGTGTALMAVTDAVAGTVALVRVEL